MGLIHVPERRIQRNFKPDFPVALNPAISRPDDLFLFNDGAGTAIRNHASPQRLAEINGYEYSGFNSSEATWKTTSHGRSVFLSDVSDYNTGARIYAPAPTSFDSNNFAVAFVGSRTVSHANGCMLRLHLYNYLRWDAGGLYAMVNARGTTTSGPNLLDGALHSVVFLSRKQSGNNERHWWADGKYIGSSTQSDAETWNNTDARYVINDGTDFYNKMPNGHVAFFSLWPTGMPFAEADCISKDLYSRLLKPLGRAVIKPVSGLPTLASIAASNLTTSGARLTVT